MAHAALLQKEKGKKTLGLPGPRVSLVCVPWLFASQPPSFNLSSLLVNLETLFLHGKLYLESKSNFDQEFVCNI
jgi:hypothetical protein